MATHIMPTRCDPSVRAPRVNLTRRGRFVFIGLPVITGSVALLVVAAIFLMPSTVMAGTAPVAGPVTQSVTVQSGQSLWDIAVQADQDRDPRHVMDDIVQLNDLTTSRLSAGQVLEVPVG